MLTEGPDEGATITVVVADDEHAVVEVLSALIGAERDLRLVGSAADADGAISLASREHPDVALVDVRMPGGGGLRAAREIVRRSPATRVIALTAHEDEETVIAMMAAGAHAYVPKGESTERILREIHRGKPDRSDTAGASGAPEDPRRDIWGHAAAPVGPGARRRGQRGRVREVIEQGALRTALQPIFDLRTGSVVGAEALPRVVHPPLRGPDAWFAEAEAVGMLPALEALAIRTALAGLPEIPSTAFMSINVSPGAIDSDEVQDAFADAPADRLVLEVTEHTIVADYVGLNRSLAPMRSRGFRLAVDDVGSGVSSLRHVVMLSPDILKIDLALTHGVDHDPTRHAVVAALADCASKLGAASLAEGVGTRAEVEHLIGLGVTLGQGSLLAEPELLDVAVSAGPLNPRRRDADARKQNVRTDQPRRPQGG